MRLLSLVLAVLVASCAETTPLDDLAEAGPSFKTQQAALLPCSSLRYWENQCPSGQHISFYPSDLNCRLSRLAYVCEGNTNSFSACDLSCPGGWHVTRRYYDDGCYPGDGVTSNTVTCERDSGSFQSCGGCPSGWHVESFTSDEACETKTSSDPLPLNKANCKP